MLYVVARYNIQRAPFAVWPRTLDPSLAVFQDRHPRQGLRLTPLSTMAAERFINRLHSAVKARIEKKNTFQKLTAIGMKGRYRVTYFHTTSPGKFEKVGGQTLKYDSAIFPLYDGYAPGAENTEVYEEGGKNVWPRWLCVLRSS